MRGRSGCSLAALFQPPGGQGTRTHARRLFWLGMPHLLLWVMLLAIVLNATSITLFVDLLVDYESNPAGNATRATRWPNLTALW